MKHCYEAHEFKGDAAQMIEQAEQVMTEYAADGYDLTLRQLYYYFVAHDLFPESRKYILQDGKWIKSSEGTNNAEPNYKWLGDITNDGRLGGHLDWDVMVDRTRELRRVAHWDGPGEIVSACASQFRLDTRSDQDCYIEVWVEKEALAGVVVPVCHELDVHSLVCRGYVSQSAMWQASQRFADHASQDCVLLYLGDHDPSGIDMTRDIRDRLNDVFGESVEVVRIALTMDQIEEFSPPPNPAKLTDSRCSGYIKEFGDECWEMDALDPRTLTRIIRDAVNERTQARKRNRLQTRQSEHRRQLAKIAERLAQDPGWEPR